MSNRDTGIRNLIPGIRTPDEIKEDQNTRRYVETIVNQRAQVSPEDEPLGELLVRTTPSLNLTSTPKVATKETKDFRSQKEYENHLINSPTKTQRAKALQEGKRILEDKKLIKFALEESPEPIVKNPLMKKAIEAKRNKWANEWMTGGGRDPKGRSLDQEIKLGKDAWLKNQKTIGQLKALKEYHQPKDKTVAQLQTLKNWGLAKPKAKPMPITTYVDKMNVLYSGQEKRKVDDQGKPIDTSKGYYVPWYDRMAQEEAEALNEVKRTTWEKGGRVNPEPKYVNALDVKNVYEEDQPEASPVQMKQLHKRLQNYNDKK